MPTVYEFELPDGRVVEMEAPSEEAAIDAFNREFRPNVLQRIGENAKAATRGSSGVLRAPRALFEGAKSLGLDVAAGVTDGNTPLGESLARTRNEYREQVDERRAADEAAAPGSVAVGDVAAGLLPLPAGKAKAADTLFQAVRRGATEGVVMANLAYQGIDDRTFSTIVGAAVPGAMQALNSFRGVVKNAVVRRLNKRADKESSALAAQAKAGFVDPNTGQVMPGLDDYTIAQVSGDPRLSSLAGRSKDVRARDVMRQQFDQRLKNVKSVMDNISTTNMPPEQRAAVLHSMVKQERFRLRQQANSAYENGIKAISNTAEGQALRVPLTPIKNALLELENDMGDVFNILRGANDERLAREIRKLKDGNVSALKLEGLMKFKQDINHGRVYGMVTNEQAAADRVRNRLMQAIDETVAQGPDTEAYRSLRAVEQQYAKHSDGIRRMEADAIVRLFGDKAAFQAGPDALYDQFIRLSPDQQRYGVDLIGAHNPEMLQFMRKRYLQDVLDRATAQPTPAMNSTLDTNELYLGLTSKEFQKNPLFTAQEKKWAKGAADDIRVILNSAPDITRPGLDITAEDVAINAISRSPEFVARLAARAITGLKLEDILFSQAGRQALKTTSTIRTSTQKKVNMATAYWLSLLANEPGALEEEPPQQ